ncbi:hypothetical protein SRHO_G00115720, partial [Serrasalmus rhombeus]
CNGRIVKDERWQVQDKNPPEKEGAGEQKRYALKVKMEGTDEEQEKERHTAEQEENTSFRDVFKRESLDLRNNELDASSDSESEGHCIKQKKHLSSEEDSESSSREEEEEEEVVRKENALSKNMTRHNSSSMTNSNYISQQLEHHEPLKRDPSTSPSTEEDAIQGMLSMAGLLFPHSSEEGANSQESWWSCTTHPSPDYSGKEPISGEENLDSDSNSTVSSQEERRVLKPQCREGQSLLDSQGSCSSSEAWGSHTHSPGREDSPPSGYQYCETSLSPPLHPSKRLAPNPPPISNQATKGKRPKKGMATAKQRLGKILKLNRRKPFFV